MKKIFIFGFVIIMMLWIIGCGNASSSSKTWTKDQVINAFKNEGIDIQNVTDIKDSAGDTAISDAISFTSGDLTGSIMIMDSSEDLAGTAKQLEDSQNAAIKYVLNGNVLITIINTTGADLSDSDVKSFKDALKSD